jgi:hypothetical protein
MARGNGDDVGLPAAVQIFAAPPVLHVKLFVHVFSLTVACGKLQADPMRQTMVLSACRIGPDFPGIAHLPSE